MKIITDVEKLRRIGLKVEVDKDKLTGALPSVGIEDNDIDKFSLRILAGRPLKSQGLTLNTSSVAGRLIAHASFRNQEADFSPVKLFITDSEVNAGSPGNYQELRGSGVRCLSTDWSMALAHETRHVYQNLQGDNLSLLGAARLVKNAMVQKPSTLISTGVAALATTEASGKLDLGVPGYIAYPTAVAALGIAAVHVLAANYCIDPREVDARSYVDSMIALGDENPWLGVINITSA